MPVETRVLPTPVLEAQMMKVGSVMSTEWRRRLWRRRGRWRRWRRREKGSILAVDGGGRDDEREGMRTSLNGEGRCLICQSNGMTSLKVIIIIFFKGLFAYTLIFYICNFTLHILIFAELPSSSLILCFSIPSRLESFNSETENIPKLLQIIGKF